MLISASLWEKHVSQNSRVGCDLPPAFAPRSAGIRYRSPTGRAPPVARQPPSRADLCLSGDRLGRSLPTNTHLHRNKLRSFRVFLLFHHSFTQNKRISCLNQWQLNLVIVFRWQVQNVMLCVLNDRIVLCNVTSKWTRWM